MLIPEVPLPPPWDNDAEVDPVVGAWLELVLELLPDPENSFFEAIDHMLVFPDAGDPEEVALSTLTLGLGG